MKTAAAHQSYSTVAVPRSIMATLKVRAKQRGISTSDLINRLLSEIVDSNLVDAVLDDGVKG